MRIRFRAFKIKDIVFLAIVAALLFLCSALALPLMTITLFGLRNLATAVFYALFGTIALMKVGKAGALSLLGIFNGAILFMMSPVMFVTTAMGAVLAELVTLLIFRGYTNPRAILLANILWMPLSLPFTALFTMLVNGQSFAEVVQFSPWVVLTCVGTVALSAVGALLGQKIGTEMKKAGKLK